MQELFEENAELNEIRKVSPGLMTTISKYVGGVQRKIEIGDWVPAECEYSCGDMCIFWKVKK